jgi:hypothetical protein
MRQEAESRRQKAEGRRQKAFSIYHFRFLICHCLLAASSFKWKMKNAK